jgi:hypothetical protein
MPNHKNSIFGFLSYARKDDEFENGKLTNFAKHLSTRISMQAAIDFKIYIDKKELKWGDQWLEKLKEVLEFEAIFLFPIITPNFFKSSNCKKEILTFLEREEQLGRNDLIKPVYYIESDRFEAALSSSKNNWVGHLAKRQYLDLREFRSLNIENDELNKILAKIAIEIAGSIKEIKKGKGKRKTKIFIAEKEIIEKNIPKDDEADKIEQTYLGQTDTQKILIRLLYKVHPPRISVDELRQLFLKKAVDKNAIGTDKEALYRLKDLEHQGLLELRSIGSKTTLVLGIGKVAMVLHDRGHIGS